MMSHSYTGTPDRYVNLSFFLLLQNNLITNRISAPSILEDGFFFFVWSIETAWKWTLDSHGNNVACNKSLLFFLEWMKSAPLCYVFVFFNRNFWFWRNRVFFFFAMRTDILLRLTYSRWRYIVCDRIKPFDVRIKLTFCFYFFLVLFFILNTSSS